MERVTDREGHEHEHRKGKEGKKEENNGIEDTLSTYLPGYLPTYLLYIISTSASLSGIVFSPVSLFC